jgi:hypothetical protein
MAPLVREVMVAMMHDAWDMLRLRARQQQGGPLSMSHMVERVSEMESRISQTG